MPCDDQSNFANSLAWNIAHIYHQLNPVTEGFYSKSYQLLVCKHNEPAQLKKKKKIYTHDC